MTNKETKDKNKRRKKLSNRPQGISQNTWYYEERAGIYIIHYYKEDVSPVSILIPWSKLKRTFERKYGK